MYTVSRIPNGRYRIVRSVTGDGGTAPVFRPYWFAYKWLLKERLPFQGHQCNPQIDTWARRNPRLWWLISNLPDISKFKEAVLNQVADYGATNDYTASLIWRAADKLEAVNRLVGQIRGDWLIIDPESGEVEVHSHKGQLA